MTATVTDRALRYRAINLIPDHPKVCAFCGQTEKLMVAHVDGFEDHLEVDNLTWSCRSCNSLAANTLQSAGMGRRTHQFNPSGGAKSVGQWLQAVGAITPHEDRGERGLVSDMKVSDAVAMIRATPHSKRSEFARKIRSSARGRASARWNPAMKKKRNLFGFGQPKALSARQTTAARGGIAAHMPGAGGGGRRTAATSEATAGSYGGYRIVKTPDGEFYSSLDPDSLFSTKKQATDFIDWWKKGRGNPAKSKGNPPKRFYRGVDKKGRESFWHDQNVGRRMVMYPAAEAKLLIATGQASVVPKTFKLKRNPADAAVEVFEEFHGHAPDEIVEVKKKIHFHKHLAGAGLLKRLVVKGIDGQAHSINGFRGALLAFNVQRNQLFVEGGDQRINLDDFGIKRPHELETLGKVKHIDYATRKDHLGDEGGDAVYTHQFRTTNEDGQHVVVTITRYPDLIYRVRDEQLEFSGGSYEIRAEGIDK